MSNTPTVVEDFAERITNSLRNLDQCMPELLAADALRLAELGFSAQEIDRALRLVALDRVALHIGSLLADLRILLETGGRDDGEALH